MPINQVKDKIHKTDFDLFLQKISWTKAWKSANKNGIEWMKKIITDVFANENTYKKALDIASAYSGDCGDAVLVGLIQMENITKEAQKEHQLLNMPIKKLYEFYREEAIQAFIMDFIDKKTRAGGTFDVLDEYLAFTKKVGGNLGINVDKIDMIFEGLTRLHKNNNVIDEFYTQLRNKNGDIDEKRIQEITVDYILKQKPYILENNKYIKSVLDPIKANLHKQSDAINTVNSSLSTENNRLNRLQENLLYQVEIESRNAIVDAINKPTISKSNSFSASDNHSRRVGGGFNEIS